MIVFIFFVLKMRGQRIFIILKPTPKHLYTAIVYIRTMLVSNTSTLVLLAKIHCLQKFIELSPLIEIPEQVRIEALFQENSYDARLIKKLIDEKKLNVVVVNTQKVKKVMEDFRLDEGEAAAYVHFTSNKHKALLTDDGELIKLCKLEDIPFLCAMAVVIRLYEKKVYTVQQTKEYLVQLRAVGRYAESIFQHFMSEVK
jgi:predicted nucleic acid-binding protein